MKQFQLRRDERAAATELGYVFTFLLGVLLLTMFSVWAWDIETATRTRWNENAIEANMDDIAAALREPMKQAESMGHHMLNRSNGETEADESRFKLVLTDIQISLVDEGGTLDTSVLFQERVAGSHEGEIYLGWSRQSMGSPQ